MATDRLATLLPDWHLLLQRWAADGRLSAAAQEALLLDGEPELLSELTAQWTVKDFSGLPPIILLPASSMPGAAGAYSDSTGTIYLNDHWLQHAPTTKALAVLTEELGHYLDSKLNELDTPGDEGATFAKALLPSSSNSSDALDDNGSVVIEGQDIAVQFSSVPTHEVLGEGSRVRLTGTMTPLNQAGHNIFIPESGGNVSFSIRRSYNWRPSFGQAAPIGLQGGLEVYAVTGNGFKQRVYNSTSYLDAGTPSFSYTFPAPSRSEIATDGSLYSIFQVYTFNIRVQPYLASPQFASYLFTVGDYNNDGFHSAVNIIVQPSNDGQATFTISGTPVVGQTLTASLATSDPDGNGSPISYTWQASVDSTNWTTIRTGPELTIGKAQEGKEIRLLSTYTDSQGFAEEVLTPAGIIPYLPPVVAIAPLSAIKSEGNSKFTPFTFRVTRTGDLSAESTARWTVTGSGDNPADMADFANGRFPSGTVRFLAGQSARNITVRIAGDKTLEPDEQFTVSLSEPSGASIDPAFSTAIGTITNDDEPPPPQLTISRNSAVKAEGSAGSTLFTFTVTRAGDISQASSANWAVTGIGANPADAADFERGVLPTGTVRFLNGETSRTITVNVRADRDQEADEQFRVTLSDPSFASISTARATGIIRNDDLIGTSAADTIVGTRRPEFIDGLAGQDTLTGGAGPDVFGFRFGQSRIRTPDRITDFRFGQDKIAPLNGRGQLHAAPVAFSRAADNSTASTLAALANAVFADANGRAAGNQPLAANAAALVRSTNAAIAGTYLLINNGSAARSLTADLMVNITGYSGTLPALGVRPVGLVFG
ncbi:MAG: hypothetical protein KFB97_12615 [Cyanobium sp. M30B3]|nr:MAG: hypothetical protein KFB97_12615 [Cyanobium sp. M30B3]